VACIAPATHFVTHTYYGTNIVDIPYNWDGKELESNEKNGITRHILLVRHGQYDESHKEEDDHKRVLTSLGR